MERDFNLSKALTILVCIAFVIFILVKGTSLIRCIKISLELSRIRTLDLALNNSIKYLEGKTFTQNYTILPYLIADFSSLEMNSFKSSIGNYYYAPILSTDNGNGFISSYKAVSQGERDAQFIAWIPVEDPELPGLTEVNMRNACLLENAMDNNNLLSGTVRVYDYDPAKNTNINIDHWQCDYKDDVITFGVMSDVKLKDKVDVRVR